MPVLYIFLNEQCCNSGLTVYPLYVLNIFFHSFILSNCFIQGHCESRADLWNETGMKHDYTWYGMPVHRRDPRTHIPTLIHTFGQFCIASGMLEETIEPIGNRHGQRNIDSIDSNLSSGSNQGTWSSLEVARMFTETRNDHFS